MSGPEKSTRRFVIDTNVFVAAVKPFSKAAPPFPAGRKTLGLLTRLLIDPELELRGNERLASEYRRLAEALDSNTSRFIVERLIAKMRLVPVSEAMLRRCKPYLPKGESADVIHAATCLQTQAILTTNDTDFNRIRRAGFIEVWSISEALRNLVPGGSS